MRDIGEIIFLLAFDVKRLSNRLRPQFIIVLMISYGIYFLWAVYWFTLKLQQAFWCLPDWSFLMKLQPWKTNIDTFLLVIVLYIDIIVRISGHLKYLAIFLGGYDDNIVSTISSQRWRSIYYINLLLLSWME